MIISDAYAIAASFCFALSSMLLGELKGRVPLFQVARWQMVATFVMTGVVSFALGGWRSVGAVQFITALLFSLTAPFAVALGYLVYGEVITARQGLGVALVLAGILLALDIFGSRADAASAARPAAGPGWRWGFWPGIVFGVITALGQAVGSLLARPAMAAGVEPFTAMAVRSGLAAVLFLVLSATPLGRSSQARSSLAALALVVGSAFVGTTLGMSLLMAALHAGNVGIVSTLSSMTPVLILPMVWVKNRHRPKAVAWVGAGFAIAGTALISLH